MRGPDGHQAELSGVYREIDRPHRLAMTCRFSDDPSGQDQLLELSFSESGGSTTVVLVNSRIPTEERHDSQAWGWDLCFTELESALAWS